jgi:ribosome-binding protein aMBF1 (putative translation factor)
MRKNGNEYYCDVCGKFIVKCDTEINYDDTELMCDKCATYIGNLLKKHTKDTSEYCKHLRNKEKPFYPQGCALGNATSPLWCEKKEHRCQYFENQDVVK